MHILSLVIPANNFMRSVGGSFNISQARKRNFLLPCQAYKPEMKFGLLFFYHFKQLNYTRSYLFSFVRMYFIHLHYILLLLCYHLC